MLLTGRFKRRPKCLELERQKQAKSPRNKQDPLDLPCHNHRNLMTIGQAFCLRRHFIYLPPWRVGFDGGVSVRNQANGTDRINATIWAPMSDCSCRKASLPCYRRRLVKLRAAGPTMFEQLVSIQVDAGLLSTSAFLLAACSFLFTLFEYPFFFCLDGSFILSTWPCHHILSHTHNVTIIHSFHRPDGDEGSCSTNRFSLHRCGHWHHIQYISTYHWLQLWYRAP